MVKLYGSYGQGSPEEERGHTRRAYDISSGLNAHNDVACLYIIISVCFKVKVVTAYRECQPG